MIYLALILTVFSSVFSSVLAACPAAPVGDAGDRVIQFVQNGDGVTGIGATNTIDATEEGAVVYDATNDTLAVCDGTNWVELGGGGSLPACNVDEYLRMTATGWQCDTGYPPAGTDSTPNAFSISNLTGLEPNTLTTSNIVQITGIDTQATVTISGDGTPEFRVCADVGCSSVITNWRSGFDTIEFGRYLQLRASSLGHSLTGTVNYSVGTTNAAWDVKSRHRIAFVTDGTWRANLGGQAGADAKCTSAKNSAGLSGTFYAWIATASSNAPIARFTHSTTPYYMPDGVKLADSWTDLTDGTLDNRFDADQYGNIQGGYAWTGVNSDGSADPDDCQNWTNQTSSSYDGTYGQITTSVSPSWSNISDYQCNGTALRHLYCFEQ